MKDSIYAGCGACELCGEADLCDRCLGVCNPLLKRDASKPLSKRDDNTSCESKPVSQRLNSLP